MPSELLRDAWYGCYAQSLRALLAPAVPAHPAKMAWGLALRLLAHVKAEGWLPPGGVVLDPLKFHPALVLTLAGMVVMGAIAGVIPAFKAYGTDVASNLVTTT